MHKNEIQMQKIEYNSEHPIKEDGFNFQIRLLQEVIVRYLWINFRNLIDI